MDFSWNNNKKSFSECPTTWETSSDPHVHVINWCAWSCILVSIVFLMTFDRCITYVSGIFFLDVYPHDYITEQDEGALKYLNDIKLNSVTLIVSQYQKSSSFTFSLLRTLTWRALWWIRQFTWLMMSQSSRRPLGDLAFIMYLPFFL